MAVKVSSEWLNACSGGEISILNLGDVILDLIPEKLELIHKIKTDDPSGIERYWHHRFKEKRKGGEWFDLSASDVKAFKRRKTM